MSVIYVHIYIYIYQSLLLFAEVLTDWEAAGRSYWPVMAAQTGKFSVLMAENAGIKVELQTPRVGGALCWVKQQPQRGGGREM